MGVKYEFVNPIDFPKHFDPTKQYNTRIVNTFFDVYDDFVIQLEYLGTIYNEKEKSCLLPVREELDYLIHPFVD